MKYKNIMIFIFIMDNKQKILLIIIIINLILFYLLYNSNIDYNTINKLSVLIIIISCGTILSCIPIKKLIN